MWKKCWFWGRGENRSIRRITSRSRKENQQTQPTWDTEWESRTRLTLVGGECSHHYAIPAPVRNYCERCQSREKERKICDHALITFLGKHKIWSFHVACCFAEDGKEMYENVERTCRVIVFARCHCRPRCLGSLLSWSIGRLSFSKGWWASLCIITV